MKPLEKAQKRLVGKHLYYNRKRDNQTTFIGEYIGKVIDVTNSFSILVKNDFLLEPTVFSIVELNELHLKSEICILKKAIKR